MTSKRIPALILLLTATIFAATFVVHANLPTTGVTAFLVKENQAVGLELKEPELISETEAILRWTTKQEAITTAIINEERVAFGAARTFSKELTGLSAGSTYTYKVRACGAESCEEKEATFTLPQPPTQQEKETASALPLTGAIIAQVGSKVAQVAKVGEKMQTLQSIINFMLYAMLGVTVLAIAGKVGYERFSNRDPVSGLVNRAQKQLEEAQHQEAYTTYLQAREAYQQLEQEAKLKHYDNLLSIYRSLKHYAEIREAQRLAERYSNGTITRDEFERLNELLTR